MAAKAESKHPKMTPILRWLYPKIMTPFMEVQQEYDKGFYASDKYIGCGVCRNVCPCRTITIEHKRR